MNKQWLFPKMLWIQFILVTQIFAQIEFNSHTITGGELAVDGTESAIGADLDNDGDIDIISVSGYLSDYKITWHENIGDRYFNSHILIDKYAKLIYTTDIDSDGDVDILASSSKSILWFENDGNAQFTIDTLIANANSYSSICATDMDNDGDMDIIAASCPYNIGTLKYHNRIVWHENDGNESFTSHTIITMNNLKGSWSICVADLDGDKDMDVVSASTSNLETEDKINWYENMDNAIFNKHTITTDNGGFHSIKIEDLDSDGNEDILVASFYKIIWYKNDGNACFNIPAIITSTKGIRAIDVSDLDNDGDMDVLSAYHDNSIICNENDGKMCFNYDTLVTNTGYNYTKSINVADLDNDGDKDLFSAASFSYKYGEIAWYENDGKEQFHTVSIATGANGAESVYAADMDNDGDIDVLSAARYADKVFWYENDGNERFIAQTITSDIENALYVNAADLDNDGDMDVISASPSEIYWFENDGYMGFNVHTLATNTSSHLYMSDIDNDGDMDVVSTYGSYDIVWFENDGNAFFSSHYISKNNNYVPSIFAADMDRDGDMDVLYSSSKDEIVWCENNGVEIFTPHVITNNADNIDLIFTADLDSDGDMDVLSTFYHSDNYDGKIVWYENNGNEHFKSHIIATTGHTISSIYAVDIDNDKAIDILTTSSSNNTVILFENDGAEHFIDHVITTDADGARSVYAADVDSDGDLDVLSASAEDGKIAWYENLIQLPAYLPIQNNLYQNYPNPFNTSTNISFDVKETDHVTLKIFDILGRSVATLVDENSKRRNYKIEFDASNMASGIYFYQIQIGDYTTTKKMLLTR